MIYSIVLVALPSTVLVAVSLSWSFGRGVGEKEGRNKLVVPNITVKINDHKENHNSTALCLKKKNVIIKEELNIAPNEINLLSNSQIFLRDFNGPRERECAFGVSFEPKYVHCFVLSLQTVINKVILNSSLFLLRSTISKDRINP